MSEEETQGETQTQGVDPQPDAPTVDGEKETILEKAGDAAKEEVLGDLHISISKGAGADTYLIRPRTAEAVTIPKTELVSWIDSQLA